MAEAAKEKSIVLAVLSVLVGLLIMAGALAAWHYWQMDGVIAFIVAAGGATLVSHGVGSKSGGLF